MSEAAHGEPEKHEVFERPFKVQPTYETRKTPSNYRRYPDGDKLPSTVKVWLVGNERKRQRPFGTVSRSWGYDDSPDAEVLTVGYNTGKENGAVGVGRHGNFLQWGFGSPPSKMTDAGRHFFLNCIVYITKFDGKAPLIQRKAGHRFQPLRLAMAMSYIEDKKFFSGTFPSDLTKRYGNDWKGLMGHYRENYEYIYRDGPYRIDEELKALNILSNREIETLERLVTILEDKDKPQIARKLLKRYTLESFQSPDEWRAWLAKHHGRIYFSDVGGYKFRVIPEGYLEEGIEDTSPDK